MLSSCPTSNSGGSTNSNNSNNFTRNAWTQTAPVPNFFKRFGPPPEAFLLAKNIEEHAPQIAPQQQQQQEGQRPAVPFLAKPGTTSPLQHQHEQHSPIDVVEFGDELPQQQQCNEKKVPAASAKRHLKAVKGAAVPLQQSNKKKESTSEKKKADDNEDDDISDAAPKNKTMPMMMMMMTTNDRNTAAAAASISARLLLAGAELLGNEVVELRKVLGLAPI